MPCTYQWKATNMREFRTLSRLVFLCIRDSVHTSEPLLVDKCKRALLLRQETTDGCSLFVESGSLILS